MIVQNCTTAKVTRKLVTTLHFKYRKMYEQSYAAVAKGSSYTEQNRCYGNRQGIKKVLTLSRFPLSLVGIGIDAGRGVQGPGDAEEAADGVAAADAGGLAAVCRRGLAEGGGRDDAGRLRGLRQRRRLLSVLRVLDLLRPLRRLVPHDPATVTRVCSRCPLAETLLTRSSAISSFARLVPESVREKSNLSSINFRNLSDLTINVNCFDDLLCKFCINYKYYYLIVTLK